MLHKIMVILAKMRAYYVQRLQPVTIGELARFANKPYSSVKRWLEIAENSGLIESDIRPYKSTGKRVFWLTDKGFVWLDGYKGMFS
jgi:hypothetical protein